MRPAFFRLLALLAPLFVAAPAVAQSVQPLDRLLPEIRRTHPGQFYDADGPHPGAGGSQHYHLKWLTPDGRIVWYDADARTGRILGASPGRDSFDARGGGRYQGRGDYYGPPPDPAAREDVRRGHFGENSGPGYDAPPGGGWSRGGGQYGPRDYDSRGGYGGRGFGGGQGQRGGEHGGGGGHRDRGR